MTQVQASLMDIIRLHVGEHNAIHVKDCLSILTGKGFEDLDERVVRRAAQELVRIEGMMVCSSEKGFYRPKDEAEGIANVKKMRAIGNEYIIRANALDKAIQLAFSPQATLPLGRAIEKKPKDV